MTDQEEHSLKETKRKERRIKEDAERLAKEQVRKKAYLRREEAIEKDLKAKKAKRTKKQTAEEIVQSDRYRIRREANLAREETIIKAQKERKLRDKRQSES